MKCRLSPRKLDLCRRLGGRQYTSAWVRGGWTHYRALCFYEERGQTKSEFVDYSAQARTMTPDERALRRVNERIEAVVKDARRDLRSRVIHAKARIDGMYFEAVGIPDDYAAFETWWAEQAGHSRGLRLVTEQEKTL